MSLRGLSAPGELVRPFALGRDNFLEVSQLVRPNGVALVHCRLDVVIIDPHVLDQLVESQAHLARHASESVDPLGIALPCPILYCSANNARSARAHVIVLALTL